MQCSAVQYSAQYFCRWIDIVKYSYIDLESILDPFIEIRKIQLAYNERGGFFLVSFSFFVNCVDMWSYVSKTDGVVG